MRGNLKGVVMKLQLSKIPLEGQVGLLHLLRDSTFPVQMHRLLRALIAERLMESQVHHHSEWTSRGSCKGFVGIDALKALITT